MFRRCIPHPWRPPGLLKRPAHRSRYSALSRTFFISNDRWQLSGLALPGFHPSSHKDSSTSAVQPVTVQPVDALSAKLRERLPPMTITQPTTVYPPPHVTEYKPLPELTAPKLLGVYSQLSKTRLTTLVVLTAMSGVAMSPLPTTVPVLLATAVGTALCSASANTFNQLSEIPFDAQMTRTRNRPLVRRAITPLHAAGFGVATGIAGPAVLWAFVNPLTATLGLANLVLYAGVYTPLKRVSVVNTWVGAVVGGIPPLMGWTACNGHLLPSSAYPVEFFPPPFITDATSHLTSMASDNPLSALALFMLLFSWQFPHFNSLSHMVRTSYAQGGYHMLSALNPRKNALVSLRHSVLLTTICSILTPLAGMTTWAFALTSLAPNAILMRSAWRFWRKGGEKEAKRLFHDSLWYLPVILGLMMFHKQGVSWGEWVGWSSDAEEKEKISHEQSE